MDTFTLVHVVLSLIGIGAGFLVVGAMLVGRRLGFWTEVFLVTTVATSITGFGFPFEKFLPSHAFGIISLIALVAAIWTLYFRQLAGAARWIYVFTAILALYLNVFVLIAQAFLKVQQLKDAAPTQTEPPFMVTQLVSLVVFVLLGVVSLVRFRNNPSGVA